MLVINSKINIRREFSTGKFWDMNDSVVVVASAPHGNGVARELWKPWVIGERRSRP